MKQFTFDVDLLTAICALNDKLDPFWLWDAVETLPRNRVQNHIARMAYDRLRPSVQRNLALYCGEKDFALDAQTQRELIDRGCLVIGKVPKRIYKRALWHYKNRFKFER